MLFTIFVCLLMKASLNSGGKNSKWRADSKVFITCQPLDCQLLELILRDSGGRVLWKHPEKDPLRSRLRMAFTFPLQKAPQDQGHCPHSRKLIFQLDFLSAHLTARAPQGSMADVNHPHKVCLTIVLPTQTCSYECHFSEEKALWRSWSLIVLGWTISP